MGQKEDILLSIIQGPAAAAWAGQNRGWELDSTLDGCGWEGIRCDPIDYSVTRITLPGVGIFGTIPPGLGQFTSLVALDLFGNRFVGTVPQEVLDLPILEMFNVANSGLEGSFPLFRSKAINFLNINGNGFGGQLPSDLGDRFPCIITMELANNTLRGTLPTSMISLTNINKFDVGHNQLVGTIPDNVGNMARMEGLFLNDNRLIGIIPRSLANPMSRLIQIFVQHNALSGPIPSSLSEIPNLVDLFLDGNKLTGTVPLELCKKTLNHEFFAQVSGAESRTGCDTLACPVNSRSEAGVFPCQPCPAKRVSPYLGHSGNCILIDQKNILDSFYNDAKGSTWIGAPRWGNPNIPVCRYEGIDCDQHDNVVNITLANMNLQGKISYKLGRLRHLRQLSLAGNHLTGEVPSDLRFAPLVHLDISGNQLEGPIPPMLCLTGGINGNGIGGDYYCDVISCSAGTWHPHGFAKAGGGSCLPCPGASTNLIGQLSCGSVLYSSFENMSYMAKDRMGYVTYVTVAVLALAALLALVVIGRRKPLGSTKRTGNQSFYDKDGYDARNGVSDTAFEVEYADEPEELAVMSYDRQEQMAPHEQTPRRRDNITPPLQVSLGSSHQRVPSPDDDPDTQDLWLDVPKIA